MQARQLLFVRGIAALLTNATLIQRKKILTKPRPDASHIILRMSLRKIKACWC